jgi:transposase InsO family protein
MKELSLSDIRLDFVRRVLDQNATVTEACEAFGISRPTGYKILARFKEEGVAGLPDRSRAPLHCPHSVSAALIEQILAAKGLPMCRHWGPKKVRAHLQRVRPDAPWPASSTFAEIFRRHGHVVPRVCRESVPHAGDPLTQAQRPNHVWRIDYKGQFQTLDSRWCYPLTVTDDETRYLIRCQGMPDTRGAKAWPCFVGAFRELGLPERIRSDNGAPFAAVCRTGPTPLSLKFLKLGIVHERMRPATPTQNPRHERMHKTLKAETTVPPSAYAAAQQDRFNLWREEFNVHRPHEGIGMRRPADLYSPSPRPFPEYMPPLRCEEGMNVHLVRPNGAIRWRGVQLYIGQLLAGEHVALDNFDDGYYALYVGSQPLAIVDERTKDFLGPKAAKPFLRTLRGIEGKDKAKPP